MKIYPAFKSQWVFIQGFENQGGGGGGGLFYEKRAVYLSSNIFSSLSM